MQNFVEIEKVPAELVRGDHGGVGEIHFRRLMTDGDFAAPVDFVDYTIIPPGSGIGLHEHTGNEEIYVIVAGAPIVRVGNEERRIRQGSVAVVHSGQSHSLINDTSDDVAIAVVQIRLAAPVIFPAL